MEQRRRLRIAIALGAISVLAAVAVTQAQAAPAMACGASNDLLGTQAENCGGYVQVGSAEQHPGSQTNGREDSGSLLLPQNGNDSPATIDSTYAHCFPLIRPEVVSTCARPTGVPADPTSASDATPAVTISDIATFRPAPGTDHMQPDGWTVAGLDTNFYADAPQQRIPGTLLGRPAEVRFTAVGFHWDYGDGSAAALRTPGATWDQLRVAEFDPTPTSHVYRALGDYTIRLRIDYRAEYRFDGPSFVPIAGSITLPANDLRVTVGDAKTVLVNRDCTRDPGGPGC